MINRLDYILKKETTTSTHKNNSKQGASSHSRWLSSKEFAFSAGDTGDSGSISGSGDPLEEEMATHCSILAWKIRWTEEPGRLWSMGWQRVRHD